MSATTSTPCRSWAGTPAARRHRCSAEHAALVGDYRDARLAWERAAADATNDAAPDSEEMRDYRATHPVMTFGRWLTSTRDDTREDYAS